MKLMHIADVHIGVTPDLNKPWSQARAQAVKDTFAALIGIAEKEQADLLLIAGDLFHSQPLKRDLKEINYLFGTLSRTQVVIIAGNHDYINPSSNYNSYPWAENVTFITSSELTQAEFPQLNTVVWGLSYRSREMTEPVLDHIKAPDDGRFHILLAHGGDPKHLPLNYRQLSRAGFDYIALGHIHAPACSKELGIVNVGCPEPLERTDFGKRGYVLAEIEKGSRDIRWIPCSTAEYIPVTLEVNVHTACTELCRQFADSISQHGRQNIYVLTITGYRDPDVEFDPEALSALGNVAQINDLSEPEYDFDKLYHEHSYDMIGTYISAFLGESEHSSLHKKALFYGTRALLNNQSR